MLYLHLFKVSYRGKVHSLVPVKQFLVIDIELLKLGGIEAQP